MLNRDSLKEWKTEFKRNWTYYLLLCVTLASGLDILCSASLHLYSFSGKELVEALLSTSHNEHEDELAGYLGRIKTLVEELETNSRDDGKPSATTGTAGAGQQTHLSDISPYTWILGVVQIAALPLCAGALQWMSPRGRKRIYANIVSFLMLAIYIGAFSLTYNLAVLLLAVIAWLLGAAHLGEFKELNKIAGEAVGGLKAFGLVSIDGFYEEFYDAISKVDESGAALEVLSVEQRWTRDRAAWPESLKERSISTPRAMNALVEGIRKSPFCKAMVDSRAQRFLFVGSMPQRQRKNKNLEGYDLEGFDQLISLVYTMCVLELAMRFRLEKNRERVRTQCVIAGVPIWVKIVGSRYWLLHGSADTHYIIRRGTRGDAKKGEGIEKQEGTHAETIQSYRRVIESHARHARGAYEYVAALIVQAAISMDLAKDADIADNIHDVILRIYGEKSFKDYSDYLRARDRVTVEDADIDHLFILFLRLHLSDQLATDVGWRISRYKKATVEELWERSA